MAKEPDELRELHALQELSRKIATEPETETLLQRILENAVALTDAEGGTIYFYDEPSDCLVFKFVISPDPEVVKRLTGQRLKMGVGVAGKVAETRRSELVVDTSKDPRFSSGIDRLTGFHTHSMATVPLQFHDKESGSQVLVGVLQLVNKRRDVFTEEDVEKIESYGGFAASVLTKAKLYERLRRQYIGTVASLAEAVDAKDPYTHGHSLRVSAYSVALGAALALSPARLFNLRVSSILHDIGKIGIPDDILHKPGRLTNREFDQIKSHIAEGARILHPANMHPEVYEGILYHHEKWDGSGYPEKRQGEAIPLFGRIVAFADAFDTITTERSYKKAFSFEEGRAIILRDAGSHFDPNLAPMFSGLPLEELAQRGESESFEAPPDS